MTVLDVHTALIVEIGPNRPKTATDSLIQFRMRVWDLPPLDSVSISIVRWRDWYGRFWLADSSVIQRQEHVSHKCRKRRFCSGGLERSLWARFWWPLSGNDDLGNSRWTEDFGARLSGTTDEETWKSSSPAERYCVLNKDDDSRESLCESYSKGLLGSSFSWNQLVRLKQPW